jgi:hypothetical protein
MTTIYDISHGIGGLWEVHLWNDLFQLNTQDGPDRILVTEIDNLHATAEHDDPRSKKVGRIGETPSPTSPGGKTVTYIGEVQASTLALLRLSRTEFVAAFADPRVEKTMQLVPQGASYHVSPTPFFSARPLANGLVVGPERQESEQWKRSFQLGLRLSDPRVYYPSLDVDVTGSPAVVTNPGDAPVEPYLILAGASGTVHITDGTHALQFINVPSGSLLVNFADHSARVGSTPVELDVANSTWWDSHIDGIGPKATVSIAQTGASSVRVTFTPATWA